MRLRRLVLASLDELSVTGLAQRSLRAAALVAALVAWLAGGLAGAGESPVAFTLLLVCAAWCAVSPDSQLGLLVALAVGWQWFTQVDRTTSGWVLLAALSLLVFHAATSLAASAPAAAPLGADLLRPAGARFATLSAVTLAVWLGVRVSPLAGDRAPDALTVTATLLLAAVATSAAAVLRSGARSR
jgi:hypothetical protein